MSFSAHRRKALDQTVPLARRASHARSCALPVAKKLGIARETAIERVTHLAGVSLHQPASGADLLMALRALDALRCSKTRD